jgi:hypothetical protein
MDFFNLVTKIPYLMMMIIGVTLVLMLFIGGLQDLSADIETYSEEQYRSTIVLENLLNLDATPDELEASADDYYTYDRRRAVIPIEFFTQEAGSNNNIGYKDSSEGPGCYIPKVDGLDGENFEFKIEGKGTDLDSTQLADTCTTDLATDTVYSSALLVRKGLNKEPLEVLIHVEPLE